MTEHVGRVAPVSRRDRPAKPPLSRAWIIAETIDIMRREGLQAATMRRVAQALDTGPSSLYVYIANTTELHAAVLDELMGTLHVPDGGDPSEKARRLLRDYRDLLLAYPGLARSALALRPSGPNTMRFLDALLGLLLHGGMTADRAAWTSDLLMLYVVALAAEHGAAPLNDTACGKEEAGRALVEAVTGADPDEHPHIAGVTADLLGGTPEQRWEWALTVLLDGGRHTPTPAHGTAIDSGATVGASPTSMRGPR